MIFNQQISTKIAKILFERFRALFPKRRLTPAAVLELLSQTEDMAPRCGLSRQKRKYLIDLSQKFLERKIPIRKFAKMSDEEIITHLTSIKGVGRWTTEMLLMFALGREDIFAIDDWGVQNAMINLYKLDRTDKKVFREKLLKISEKWSPYRTYACMYLWRWKDNSPAVAAKKKKK